MPSNIAELKQQQQEEKCRQYNPIEFHWKDRFYSSLFSLVASSSSEKVDYFQELESRMRLWKALQRSANNPSTKGMEGNKRARRISNDCISFLPLPLYESNDEEDRHTDENDHDPIMGEFYIENYILTQPGTSSEMAFIDTTKNTIHVTSLDQLLDNAQGGHASSSSKAIGTIFRQNKKNGNAVLMEWMGLDAKCYYSSPENPEVDEEQPLPKRGPCKITLVAVRTLYRTPLDDVGHATEVFTFAGPKYSQKYYCFIHDTPYYIDVDGVFQKCYVGFSPTIELGRGNNDAFHVVPVPMRTRHIQQFSLVPIMDEADTVASSAGTVAAAQPECTITCGYDVASFAVDATGTRLVVGTDSGTVEIWHTGLKPSSKHSVSDKPTKVQTLDLTSIPFASSPHQHRAPVGNEIIVPPLEPPLMPEEEGMWIEIVDDEDEEDGHDPEQDGPFPVIEQDAVIQDPQQYHNEVLLDGPFPAVVEREGAMVAAEEEGIDDPEAPIPRFHPICSVDQVVVPPKESIDHVGFVTVQSSVGTLALWQKKSSRPFQVQALIHTRIRKPLAKYDGKRLLIYGNDHIGSVILVYHVLSSNDDYYEFMQQNSDKSSWSSIHKKVACLTHYGGKGPGTERIRLVNFIRHEGLGGDLDDYEVFFSSNEKFIVANTRAGFSLGEQSDEGLFVVDISKNRT